MSQHPPPAEERVSEGTQSVVAILHYLFGGLRLVIVLLIVGFVFSGLFILRPQENALVFRFGHLVSVKKEPRLYFGWPKPIERYQKLVVDQRRTLDCSDFWYKEEPKNILSQPDNNQAPESAPKDDPLEPGQGGYLLTGDYNILHTKWSVVYSIADAEAYYKNYDKPEDALAFALRNVILKKAARLKIETAFQDKTDEFRTEVESAFTRLVDDMHVGVRIDQVNYLQKAVPRSTREAFDEVTNAAQVKDATIKAARGYQERTRGEANGEAAKLAAEADAYRQKVVDSVSASANYLNEIRKQYEESGPAILLTRYVEALTQVVRNAQKVIVVYPNQEVRITTNQRPPAKAEDPSKTKTRKP
jgi:modulator of FtsH protease HflK